MKPLYSRISIEDNKLSFWFRLFKGKNQLNICNCLYATLLFILRDNKNNKEIPLCSAQLELSAKERILHTHLSQPQDSIVLVYDKLSYGCIYTKNWTKATIVDLPIEITKAILLQASTKCKRGDIKIPCYDASNELQLLVMPIEPDSVKAEPFKDNDKAVHPDEIFLTFKKCAHTLQGRTCKPITFRLDLSAIRSSMPSSRNPQGQKSKNYENIKNFFHQLAPLCESLYKHQLKPFVYSMHCTLKDALELQALLLLDEKIDLLKIDQKKLHRTNLNSVAKKLSKLLSFDCRLHIISKTKEDFFFDQKTNPSCSLILTIGQYQLKGTTYFFPTIPLHKKLESLTSIPQKNKIDLNKANTLFYIQNKIIKAIDEESNSQKKGMLEGYYKMCATFEQEQKVTMIKTIIMLLNDTKNDNKLKTMELLLDSLQHS